MMLWANRPGSNGETRRVITIDLGRLRLIIMGAFNHDRIHKQQLMKVFYYLWLSKKVGPFAHRTIR